MPSPATDAEPAPAPALEAVSEVPEEEDEQDEEEEVEEVEQAEEFTVTGEEVAETVEAGRDALGNGKEEESVAAEIALEDSGFQGDIEAESAEAGVRILK